MRKGLAEKQKELHRIIREMGGVVVSFSGGVDSALVLAVAVSELGEKAVGAMGVSPSIAQDDIENARLVAAAVGARLEEVETGEFGDPEYLANREDRCFRCKIELLRKLADVRNREGLAFIADGFNADDSRQNRPGQEAAKRAGVRSPLAEAGVSKSEIRELLKEMGFDFWDRPSNPCLSTRVLDGLKLEPALLRRIEDAEKRIREVVPGVRNLRVRHIGAKALVEVDLEFVPAAKSAWTRISEFLRELGWDEAALAEGGYRRGSMAKGAGVKNDVPR